MKNSRLSRDVIRMPPYWFIFNKWRKKERERESGGKTDGESFSEWREKVLFLLFLSPPESNVCSLHKGIIGRERESWKAHENMRHASWKEKEERTELREIGITIPSLSLYLSTSIYTARKIEFVTLDMPFL